MRIALANGPGSDGVGLSSPFDLAAGAATAQADLLVLPALSLGGRQGVLCDAPEVDEICQIAERVRIALVFGYLEACASGRFLAAQLVTAEGRATANYRCTHPESDRTTPLDDGHWLTIALLGERRLGLLLDADIRAPEVARALVLAGADTLVHLTTKTHLGEELLRVRAWENRCILLSISSDDAVAVGVDGAVLAVESRRPGFIVVDLPPPDRQETGTRRPELYAQVALAIDER